MLDIVSPKDAAVGACRHVFHREVFLLSQGSYCLLLLSGCLLVSDVVHNGLYRRVEDSTNSSDREEEKCCERKHQRGDIVPVLFPAAEYYA